MEVKLSRIVFFDDTLENVEGARAIGLQAVHVRALADIKVSLREIIGSAAADAQPLDGK